MVRHRAVPALTDAYADVCRTLGVNDCDRRTTDIVARAAIEFAQRGARDPVRLRDCVLRALA